MTKPTLGGGSIEEQYRQQMIARFEGPLEVQGRGG